MKTNNVYLEIEGMEELFSNLNKIEDKFEEEIERIINEGAKLIKEDVKSRVPVESGDLKESIEVKTLEIKKNHIKIGVGPVYEEGGDNDVFYWYFVEFGTKNKNAQPYLRPAFEKNKKKVRRTIKKEINRLLEKAVI